MHTLAIIHRKHDQETYKPSTNRTCKIGIDPANTLDHLLRKYLPALVRAGHRTTNVITNLVNTSYFPTENLYIYIGQININNQTIDEVVNEKQMRKLLTRRHIRWQIPELHIATYKRPHKMEVPKITEWKHKFEAKYKLATIQLPRYDTLLQRNVHNRMKK